jgi:hypothetical protein
MVILDNDFHVRQVFLDRGFYIAEPDRLEPHVGVVKILDGRLDENDFHW